MLRSREEIERKAMELTNSAEKLRQKTERVKNLLTVFLFIFLIVMVFGSITSENEVSEAPYSFLSIILGAIFVVPFLILIAAMILFHYSFRPRWQLTSRRREVIAMYLEEIISLLEKEDGEDVVFDELDKMIIEKAKGKEKIFKMPALTRNKREARILGNARLEAFTWVTSPGGVPGAKEE